MLHDARTRSETVKNAMKMFYRLLLLEQRGQDVYTFVSSELMSQLNRTRSLLLRVSSGKESVTKEKSTGKEEKEIDRSNEVLDDEETRSHRRVEMLRRFKRSIREKQKNVIMEKEEELKVERIAMGSSSIIEEEKEEVALDVVDNTADDDVFFSIGNGGDALPLQF